MSKKKQHLNTFLYPVILAVILLLSVLLSLAIGEMNIPLKSIPGILLGETESIEKIILSQIRLPRILLGIAIGGGLSISGVILQGIFKNPLVEPYTLGISGGAALGVTIAIVFGLQQLAGAYVLPICGFCGAMLTVVAVYYVSTRNGKINIRQMLLVGVMISFVASSAMMFLLSTTTDENIHGIIFWTMGSLDEPDKTMILYAVITSFLGLVISMIFTRQLNALRLGEDKARSLGVDTNKAIKILFIAASVITGVCVSVAGVIGFVGLLIPHMIRRVVGNDFRMLTLCSFIAGAIFIVLSDILSRTIISPNELPIGVITGILGGVAFIIVSGKSGNKNAIE